MSYKVVVHNEKYICHKCSIKNWEQGTKDDYMLSINGRCFNENNLLEISWFIDLLQGINHQTGEWTPENCEKEDKYGEYYGMSDRYHKWLHKKGHKVKYHDRLCNLDRTQFLSGYGFCQGYVDKRKHLDELKKDGLTKIYFKELYDIRQYDKHMDDCYIEIKRMR